VAVPPGHALVMTLQAVGTINYECRAHAGMAGAYVWTVAAHDATLRHWTGFPVGRLYQGPTWSYRDGSRLTGEFLGAVSGGAGKLQDQLWRAQASGKDGELTRIAYIRRTNATGNAPPDSPCTAQRIGQGYKTRYAAEYAFYAPEGRR
jgi:hypothetical protein